MNRIFTHPVLAGCSEEGLIDFVTSNIQQETEAKKLSFADPWCEAFVRSSGKMLALTYCQNIIQSVFFSFLHSFTLWNSFTHSLIHSLKLTHRENNPLYLLFIQDHFVFAIISKSSTKSSIFPPSRTFPYYQLTTRLFGVKTLKDFQRIRDECSTQNQNHQFSILILGSLPPGLCIPCPFISQVFVHDYDLVPSADIEYLKSTFMVGTHSPCHLSFLALANSFEGEYFIEKSKLLSSYQSLINEKSDSFYITLS